jgi:hypothetical protein
MFKYLLMVVFIAGCSEGSNTENEIITKEKRYIVAGQSNAVRPDWSYLEDLTGIKTVNIAVAGKTIDYLIDNFNPNDLGDYDYQGIIFIHGESDAIEFTQTAYYIERVELYREMISGAALNDLDLLITSVLKPSSLWVYDKSHFPNIREAVEDEAEINNKWRIVFAGAVRYEEWGMLADELHANEIGQRLMMDTYTGYINGL